MQSSRGDETRVHQAGFLKPKAAMGSGKTQGRQRKTNQEKSQKAEVQSMHMQETKDNEGNSLQRGKESGQLNRMTPFLGSGGKTGMPRACVG